ENTTRSFSPKIPPLEHAVLIKLIESHHLIFSRRHASYRGSIALASEQEVLMRYRIASLGRPSRRVRANAYCSQIPALKDVCTYETEFAVLLIVDCCYEHAVGPQKCARRRN